MKLRFRYEVSKWLMRRFRGRVIYPFILFLQEKEDVPDWLFRHELEHIYQIRRMGYIMYHIKYMLLFIKHGYSKHPFELEAIARSADPLTDKEKALRA